MTSMDPPSPETRNQRHRTTTFRLQPEALGAVHVCHAGPAFWHAWKRATQKYREENRRRDVTLPYGSLVQLLRILTGDFVRWVAPHQPGRAGPETPLLVSRQSLPPRDRLTALVRAWEQRELAPEMEGALSAPLASELSCTELQLADYLEIRPGRSPRFIGNWVWTAAAWDVAHRLAEGPLLSEVGEHHLRLTGEGTLLTWDDPVSDGRQGAAMQAIDPRIGSLPGIPEPLVQLNTRLIRLKDQWRGKPSTAWVDIDSGLPLVELGVRNHRIEGGFRTLWDDRVDRLLSAIRPEPFPQPDTEPTLDGDVRVAHTAADHTHPLGTGPGTMGHEIVAHHGHRHLADCTEPLVLERVAKKIQHPAWPEQEPVIQPHLVVLYAEPSIRNRIRDALSTWLREKDPEHPDCARLADAEDGEVIPFAGATLEFRSPPHAPENLLEAGDQESLEAWVADWLPSVHSSGGVPAILCETVSEKQSASLREGHDPKPLLRRALARAGAVSQFLRPDSAPGPTRADKKPPRDHAAVNAIRDLLRAAGRFDQAFPCKHVEASTLQIGIHLVRKKEGGFLLTMVALEADSTRPLGWSPVSGWTDLPAAITALHASSRPGIDRDRVEPTIKQAVEELRSAHPGRALILYPDGASLRRTVPWLSNTSDAPVPAWIDGEMAVVRILAEPDELPRAAGDARVAETFDPAQFTAKRLCRIESGEPGTAWYFLHGSLVMHRTSKARRQSRFGTDVPGLKENWHALNTTEFTVLATGGLEENSLVLHTTALHRPQGQPGDDRTLRYPLPLHLARGMVDDWPESRI